MAAVDSDADWLAVLVPVDHSLWQEFQQRAVSELPPLLYQFKFDVEE